MENEINERSLNNPELLKLMMEAFTKILRLVEDLYIEDFLKDSSDHLRAQIKNVLLSAENLKKEAAKSEGERPTTKNGVPDPIPENDDLSKIASGEIVPMVSPANSDDPHFEQNGGQDVFELVLHNSIIDQINNPLNALGPLKCLDLIRDEEKFKMRSSKKSEIANYLQENYINIKIHNLEQGFAKSSIKSYALKFKNDEIEKVFDFIEPRWTIFEKIWFMLSETGNEVACLFKQKSFAKPELFVKNFKETPFEFYLLRNNKSTPKKETDFQNVLNSCKVYSLLKYKKTKEDFIRNVERFEKCCCLKKGNGFGDSLTDSWKFNGRSIFSDDEEDSLENLQKKIKS